MESIDYRLSRIEKRLDRIERLISDLVRDKNLTKKLEDWIPEEEAAAMLSRRPRTLRRLVNAGEIPVRNKAIRGRNYRYYKPDLERYLRNG